MKLVTLNPNILEQDAAGFRRPDGFQGSQYRRRLLFKRFLNQKAEVIKEVYNDIHIRFLGHDKIIILRKHQVNLVND